MPPALIVTRPTRTALGLPSRIAESLGDRPVIAHTLQRIARVPGVDRLVLVHPADDDPRPLIAPFVEGIGKPVEYHADPDQLIDPAGKKWPVARAFALTSWRGGLGQATCYDELLPARPLFSAMQRFNAESALLLGADWPLIDPDLAAAVLDNHRSAPDQLKLCFTQAPPGLAPVAVHRDILQQLAEHPGSGLGPLLGYNPQRPALDPISKDVNSPIPHAVRDAHHRFILDSPRTARLIHQLARHLGDQLPDADASRIAAAVSECDLEQALPQQVTLELTPHRPAPGRITPQHHATLDRPPVDLDLARRIIDQLDPDTALRLGGLGDALLHPHWQAIAQHAADRVLCVALDTDLLSTSEITHHPSPIAPLPDETLDQLLAAPLGLVTVRLNADSAAVYQELMGIDGFPAVMDNLKRLHNRRADTPTPAVPWIVPRLAKTAANLTDMETFFERWLRLFGTAVIEPTSCGCGLMPDLAPVPMHPPARVPCRQLGGRLSVLANGKVALCDQDWQARDPLGDAITEPLAAIAARAHDKRAAHHAGQFAELTLCGQCTEWHRP